MTTQDTGKISRSLVLYIHPLVALVSNHNTQQTEDCLDISNCSQKLIGFDSQICSLYKVFLRSFQHVYHTLVYVQKGLNSHDIRKRWYVPFCDARFHSCLKWSLRPYIYRSKNSSYFHLNMLHRIENYVNRLKLDSQLVFLLFSKTT